MKYICNVCDMATSYKTSMQRHMREKHTGCMFECEVCGASYKWQTSLYKHKKMMNHGLIQGEDMSMGDGDGGGSGYFM